MKLQRKKLSVAVIRALNAGVMFGFAAPLAVAQTATPAPTVQKVERVEVTGSRIPTLNLEGTSPVQTITQQDIQLEGLTSVEQIVNRLPQAFADQGSAISNGSTGSASINLRGLGNQRTLVLIDGRRLPAGSPVNWATDVNFIPSPLIQRIEVLTGGASAVYGSDAVAGVVNFIMNDHFEGIQFGYNGNTYQHTQHNSVSSVVAAREVTNPAQFSVPGNISSDGTVQEYNMTMGANFANGKGNATIFFAYRQQDAVLQSQRDFSACSLSSPSATGGFTCGGSGTSSPPRFSNITTGRNYTYVNAAGDVRPYSNALDQFNFGPYNYYQRPDVRYQANAFAHYDVFDNVRVYAEFGFSDDRTTSQVAPGGIFAAPFTLSDANPLLSQSFKTATGIPAGGSADVIIGKRNVEGGGRTQQITLDDYRYVLGAKGDFADHKWDYDFWWQSGTNRYASTQANYFANTRIGNALDVVTDPATGRPACAVAVSGLDTNCVPYNVYVPGGVTPEALAYISGSGFSSGYTSQSVVGLHVNSDLGAYNLKTPWAKNGVGVAFGVERRVEKLSYSTDDNLRTFNLSGTGGPSIGRSGQYTVTEGLAEVRVPIMEAQPWAYLLSVNGSYRYASYSTDQDTNSYGLGAEWAPIKEVKLRATYQQAVRAPNVNELFTAQGNNLFGLGDDPCGASPGNTPTATLAQCLRTGITPAQYGSALLISPAGQGNYLQGGNPNLKPETSNSYTVGAVFQYKNFNATVDYWNIKVEDVINNQAPGDILNTCLTTGSLCDLVRRDSLGTLWLDGGGYIVSTFQNLGSYHTSGIDVTANYTWDIPRWNDRAWGNVLFSLTGTYVDEFIVQNLKNGPSFDCAGLYGATCGLYTGAPVPRWRSNVRALWSTPWNVDAAITWRYTDKVSLDTNSGDPLLAGNTFGTINNYLPARNYWDLAAVWRIDKTWTLRGGVNNILDQDPPVINNTISDPSVFGNGNTFPQVYDTLGRNFFLSVTAKF